MQSRWLLLPAASLPLFLASCTGSGGLIAGNHPTGTGPFDSRGNYVEAWADNPSQWRQAQSKPVDAVPDRPAVEEATPPVIASVTPPRPTTGSTPVVYKKPAAKPTVAKVTPKPKPKPVVKKAPVKVKPKSTRHSVRSGDNLYNIAKRYGTSVAAIQKANRIKGSMIRPGQSLVIPR